MLAEERPKLFSEHCRLGAGKGDPIDLLPSKSVRLQPREPANLHLTHWNLKSRDLLDFKEELIIWDYSHAIGLLYEFLSYEIFQRSFIESIWT